MCVRVSVCVRVSQCRLGEPESVHACGCVCVYEQVCTREHEACVCIHVSTHMCLSMYMNVSVCMCGGMYERVYTHMQMLCCLTAHAYYAIVLRYLTVRTVR